MIVVFPAGIRGKAVTQEFQYGGNNSSDHEGWGWNFDGTDQQGFLRIQSQYGDKHQYETSDWQRNGNTWVAVKDEIRKNPV